MLRKTKDAMNNLLQKYVKIKSRQLFFSNFEI